MSIRGPYSYGNNGTGFKNVTAGNQTGGSSLFGSKGYLPEKGFNQKISGTDYRAASVPQFTREQSQLFKNLFNQVGPEGFLGQLASGNPELFQEMEQPDIERFNELLGGLSSRFSGMGDLGARKSSGFQNSATRAASDFAQALRSQRLGIQQQSLRDLLGLSESLLNQRPFEQFFLPQKVKQPGFWSNLFSGLAGGAAQTGTQLGGIYGAKKLGLF
jgi:hypothetical protein